MEEKFYQNGSVQLKYYEIGNLHQPLVFIHAQGVDGKSYEKVAKTLSKHFHM